MSGDLHTSGSYERKEYFEGILKNLDQSRRLNGDVQLLPVNALDENDTLLAHKNILAAVSQYFWDSFYSEIKTGPEVAENDPMNSIAQSPPVQSTFKVKIPIDKAVLEIVLKCIYLDQCVINLDNCKGLLDASKLLKLDDLTKICYEFIKDQKVTKETWLIHFQLALNDENDEEKLKKVYEFLKTIPTEICDMEEFLGLKFHDLKMLVNGGVFGNSTDLQKAKFRWFAYENHLKTTHLNDLFKLELPNPPRIDSLQSLDESSSGNTGSSPDLNDPNFIPQEVEEVPEGQDEVKQGQQSTDTQVASSLKRKAGSTKKNPLQTKSPASKDTPKTPEDAGDPPQPPTDVQTPSKRRGRPPANKKLQEKPQTSKAPKIENKGVEPPSPKTIHKLVESTKGLTVSLGPRVKQKTTEKESMQIDIDSTTKTENISHELSKFLSSDHVRKKRAREDEEETSRKNSKVEEKKSSTSSSNEIKDKLDKPGSSSSEDSGSESSSFDPNGRGNESIKEINDKPAGIPQESPTSTIKTPDYSNDPGKHEEAQKPIFHTNIVMHEMGSFGASVFHCSHNPGELEPPNFFPQPPVTLVGHIDPVTVWDYINELKKSMEVIIFRLEPASIADTKGYMTLFSYLSSRNRLGVLGGVSAPIKDVYLLPLAKHTPIPRVLLPFNGPGLSVDGNDSLLAIVTRYTPKAPIH